MQPARSIAPPRLAPSDARAPTRWGALCCAALLLGAAAHAEPQQPPTAPHSGHVAPEGAHASSVPVPRDANLEYDATRWWSPGEARDFPASARFPNEHGMLSTIRLTASGAATLGAAAHPFFTPLGNNGRACVTCHQPSDAMSLSVDTIRERWRSTEGKDPLFAPVDGANCPDAAPGDPASHSLLLERGLFRIFRPWPPRNAAGERLEPQFDIELVRDPTGCNKHPQYGLNSSEPMISVYRRPRPVANVKYLTAVGFPFEPKNGLPLPIDPESGQRMSGNLMADGRNGTLKIQAIEAALTHLQARRPPSAEQLQAIIDFENTIYSAQSHDRWGGELTAQGAEGGPHLLAQFAAGALQGGAEPIWSEFKAWLDASDGDATPEQIEFRRSVARGAKSFATKTFLVSDSAGITSMGFGNPVRNTCAFCHNMQRTGLDVAPGQVDLGTTNEPFADPAAHLPLFKLTCKPGYRPHPHLGRVVYTSDPGYALTTGRCTDIGKITIQQMRGLAGRAPYFSNGSARTLRDVVDFYDRRYNIGYTEQEKQDLVNLMSVL